MYFSPIQGYVVLTDQRVRVYDHIVLGERDPQNGRWHCVVQDLCVVDCAYETESVVVGVRQQRPIHVHLRVRTQIRKRYLFHESHCRVGGVHQNAFFEKDENVGAVFGRFYVSACQIVVQSGFVLGSCNFVISQFVSLPNSILKNCKVINNRIGKDCIDDSLSCDHRISITS